MRELIGKGEIIATKKTNKNNNESISKQEAKGISWSIIKTIVGLLLALVIIRFYIFQPFTITGSSMEPTFLNGQYLIVDELSYTFTDPNRGDVVVFRHPEPACNDHIEASYFNKIFFQGPCANYIKRVVGLPGETVMIRDGKVSIKNDENPNGLTLSEDYILGNIPTLGNQTVILGEKEYFVLGDNRGPNASSDSREWGALPESHIVGKAFVVLLPPQEFGFVPSIEY